MKCDLHWKVWTPSRKTTFSWAFWKSGTFSPTKSGPSMASGPTVAAMFDSLQRTLASKSMINTCPLLFKLDIINRVCPFGGFKHHLQEIIYK